MVRRGLELQSRRRRFSHDAVCLGSHFPKRDQIDKFYDELAKEQSNQIAVKRRVTLGVVSQTPV
eukprot:3601411-Prorocentrum_lima.AAC.1